MTGKKAAVQAQQKQATPPVQEKKPQGGFFEGPETSGGTFLGAGQTNSNLTRARFLGL